MKQEITIPIIDAMFEALAGLIGRPSDQVKIIISFVLAYPICYMFRNIKDVNSRHLYAIVTGFMIQFFMFREGCVHIYLLMTITFMMLKFLDRKTQAEYVFAVNMAYLSALHLYNIITDFGGWTLDVTTFMMPYICRLSSLGYCYRDGMSENKDKLTEAQKERKIETLPSFIEMISYSCFPGATLCGPFFEFSDYKNFIEMTGRYANIPETKAAALNKMGSGFLFMVLSILIPIYFDANYCGEPEFKEYGFIYKNIFYYFAMAAQRHKYYSAWYLSDGAVVMSGLSYNGKDKDGEDKFDRIVSISGYEIEIGTNPRTMIDQWNHQMAEWLRLYVFTRFKTVFPKANFTATLFTMMTSAFWHGFYPVYYTFFFFAALLAEATKDLYRGRYLFKWIPSAVKPVILHIISLQALNFIGISFVLLTFDRAHNFYSSVYYYVPIGLVTVLVLFRFTPLGKIAKKAAATAAEKEGKNRPTSDKVDKKAKTE